MSDVFGWVDWDRVGTMVVDFVPKLGVAIVILIGFWAMYRLTRPPLTALLRRAGFAQALIHLLVDNVYKVVIVGLGLVMSASQLGINVGAALAGIGVVGIAVGFAAQESIANMIAGFLIFWDRPFEVGHFIETQDKYGEVRHITMRTTRIRTQENTYVVIPNKQIIGDMLVNHSMYGKTRINVPVGIAYKEQIAEAREVLLKAVRKLDGVLPDPLPTVVATGLGDSSVNLEVRIWISDASQERPIFYRVMETVKVALDAAGIEIPFPHLQLFVENVEERIWERAAKFPGIGTVQGNGGEGS